MSFPPVLSDERSPLLFSSTANYHEPQTLEDLSSLLSNVSTEVNLPQQEGVNQDLGVVKLDFRLFVSLLYDSIPGTFFLTLNA